VSYQKESVSHNARNRAHRDTVSQLSGFLLVDKPKGLTSRKVVDIIRHHAGYRGKIGHSGTLDPLATGLLVLCLGKATRLASYLIRDDKSYMAVMELGKETDTGDAEGKNVFGDERNLADLDEGSIEMAFDKQRGVVYQVPPKFSARKVDGRRAYELARSGEEVELNASQIEIKELEIIRIQKPLVHFYVKCSSGTYIRSLAIDVGRILGTGAHLKSLRRLDVGPFRVDMAEKLEEIKDECRQGNIEKWLYPMNAVLENLSRVVVDGDGERLLRQGSPVTESGFTFLGANNPTPFPGEEVQGWKDSSDFLAVGRVETEGKGKWVLYPSKVFS
jgi:tRNA pseudouridine55 synthase